MNFLEMKSMVRLLIGETVADGYTDKEVADVINLISVLKVASQVRFMLMTNHDFNVTDYTLFPSTDPRSEGRYSLPSDFAELVSVKVRDGDRWYPELTRLNEEEYSNMISTPTGGRPEFFKLELGATSVTGPARGDISFWYYPDRTYTVRISHLQRPSTLNENDDISELPEESHAAVCYHAAMVISRKHKDATLAGEMMAMYQDEIRDLLKNQVRQSYGLARRTIDIYEDTL